MSFFLSHHRTVISYVRPIDAVEQNRPEPWVIEKEYFSQNGFIFERFKLSNALET